MTRPARISERGIFLRGRANNSDCVLRKGGAQIAGRTFCVCHDFSPFVVCVIAKFLFSRDVRKVNGAAFKKVTRNADQTIYTRNPQRYHPASLRRVRTKYSFAALSSQFEFANTGSRAKCGVAEKAPTSATNKGLPMGRSDPICENQLIGGQLIDSPAFHLSSFQPALSAVTS